MLVNGGTQLVSSSTGPGGNGNVIHLMANKHSLVINGALVQVLLMGGRPEIELLSFFKDANNHFLP
jgi:hypothetical protein